MCNDVDKDDDDDDNHYDDDCTLRINCICGFLQKKLSLLKDIATVKPSRYKQQLYYDDNDQGKKQQQRARTFCHWAQIEAKRNGYSHAEKSIARTWNEKCSCASVQTTKRNTSNLTDEQQKQLSQLHSFMPRFFNDYPQQSLVIMQKKHEYDINIKVYYEKQMCEWTSERTDERMKK